MKSRDDLSGLFVLISFVLWFVAIWSPSYNAQFGFTGVLTILLATIVAAGDSK